MDDISRLVAQNFHKLREEKHLSLDRIAELSGVSKSMLSQIERGESSPTISTLWKIANGLKISFTALLNKPESDPLIIRKNQTRVLVEDEGRYRLFPIFPIHPEANFEIYRIEIDPGGGLHSDAHPDGTTEFITSNQGELLISINQEEHHLQAGDSIRFRADRPHQYANNGSELADISLVIYYPH